MMFELEARTGTVRFYSPLERVGDPAQHALDAFIGEECRAFVTIEHDPTQGRITTEFYCTRYVGHSGEHEAVGTFLGDTFVMASWE